MPTLASSRRAFLALLAAPLLLFAAMLPVVAYLGSQGLSGDERMAAAEPLAPLPVSIAFLALFFLVRRLAARDGLSLADLGWTRPRAAHLALGLVVGALAFALNDRVLHPLLRELRPAFDPTVPAVSLPAVLCLLTIAIPAENTLYRGYALVVLRERFSLAFAVIVTTAAYASLAPGHGWPLMLWAFGLGLLLAGLRLLSQSLWPVVLAHWIVGCGPKLASMISSST